MFEYHGNNLTVDADGVSVTVALATAVNIEKPIAEIDLERAVVVEAHQSVVRGGNIPSTLDFSMVEPKKHFYTEKHFLKGYAPLDYIGETYGGDGNEEVLARAIPYLEMGFRGLLAFCTDEKKLLMLELERLRERAGLLKKE